MARNLSGGYLGRRELDSPGVIQLLSNGFESGNFSPLLSAFSLTSLASLAVRKRLLRCWFILARGATPSTAIKKSFFGLILPNRWSTYAKIEVKICSSDIRKWASSSLGWEPRGGGHAINRKRSWVRISGLTVMNDPIEVDVQVICPTSG